MTELPTLTSPLLQGLEGVSHAFFTRRGGVSRGLYASLNVGLGSGDDPAAVLENRRRAAEALGGAAEALCTAYQIHSAQVFHAREPLADDRPQADGVITTRPGLICGALAADCAPVLLIDPRVRIVAAVHAGWRGAFAGVTDSAVRRMAALGADPARIIAAIGPCIGPDSYEVGREFKDQFLRQDESHERFFRDVGAAGKALFNLPAYVLHRLALEGVTRAGWIGSDTLADEDLFFSNRRATHRRDADYGRLLSAIVLTG